MQFDTIILDEVHIIKNPKTKVANAIQSLNGLHKIALSGTPIQNNVTEIWSIFEFLMPGFLGNLKNFNSEYTSTLTASIKTVGKIEETTAFETSLQNLKKAIAPFIMRRTKTQVLQDLPPKIIQDYLCHLSDIQKLIMPAISVPDIKNEDEVPKAGQSFANINKALALCDHPLLILNNLVLESPIYNNVVTFLTEAKDPSAKSGKYIALEQLFSSMGINKEDPEGTIPLHKIIIFSHYKEMLSLIEVEVLSQYKNLRYLRLDGDTYVSQRVEKCNTFNSDMGITILLSTPKIGGMGLNLTSADAVIFYDHDWNPMVDLQAMDRAHRIGQLKVLNVYRLITVDTLEEKLMQVQRFKKRISNALIESKKASVSENIDIGQIFTGIVSSID
jgi:TATA-binding protein-associated factor